MIKHETFLIDSCDDIECKVKRESKLEYRVCFNTTKELEAIVVFVQGCGGEGLKSYREHLLESIANDYNVLALNVDYHCSCNRKELGASFTLSEIDKAVLQGYCSAFDITLPFDINTIKTNDEIVDFFDYLDKLITLKKEQKNLYGSCHLDIPLSITPAKNEYQNFGIMSCMDIINALFHLKKIHNLINKPIILVGTSHGGYLSHLCAKIAPWLIDGVIDNSSYVKLNLHFCCFGKELDYTKYCEVRDKYYKNFDLLLTSKTLWTYNSQSPYYFNKARECIRDITNKEHLKIQAKYPKTRYISYHSMYDNIAPIKDKNDLYFALEQLNFDAKIHLIISQNEIDNILIHHLEHGLGMSMKPLIAKELPIMLDKIQKDKKEMCKNKSISYPSDNLVYTFTQKDSKINLEITEI